VPNNFREDNFI